MTELVFVLVVWLVTYNFMRQSERTVGRSNKSLLLMKVSVWLFYSLHVITMGSNAKDARRQPFESDGSDRK